MKLGTTMVDTHLPSTTIALPVHLLAAVALSELSGRGWTSADKEVQTDSGATNSKRTKRAPCLSKATKRRSSAQTQTRLVQRVKHPKICAETQTMSDHILKKAMQAANIPLIQETTKNLLKFERKNCIKRRKKSMETQTINKINMLVKLPNNNDSTIIYQPQKYAMEDQSMQFNSLNHFPPTSTNSLCDNSSAYKLDIDVNLTDFWYRQKNSSGTQTSPVTMDNIIQSEEILSHSVTQTDLNLAFLESESCDPSSSHLNNSSPQPIDNLHNYFEDTSDCSFNATVNNPSASLGPDLSGIMCETSINTGNSVNYEPGYSQAQVESILSRNRRVVFDDNKLCSIETQTELDFTDSFLTECTDEDPSFTLCSNIETQTTEDIPALDPLVYTNMYTQTCNEILFPDLDFADIQTQTAFPEYEDNSIFVSTETQTALSGCSSRQDSCDTNLFNGTGTITGTSHMETQTNVDEFKELIAELAKQSSTDKLL